jgi:SAM-dependent methyltransferase
VKSPAHRPNPLGETLPPDTDYGDLVTELRTRAAERRNSGELPDAFVEDIDQHFTRILQHLRLVDADDDPLHAAIAALSAPSSPIPTSNAAHPNTSLLARIRRKVGRFLESPDVVANEKQLQSRIHAMDIALHALLDRLRIAERQQQFVGKLATDLAEIRRYTGPRYFVPPYTFAEFEDHFRDPATYRETYGAVAELLVGFAPVLDIGCGKGDFLGYLKELDIAAHGVEIDIDQAQLARDRGFSVVTTNALPYLHDMEDSSLGGIVTLQVIEHFSIQERIEFFVDAFAKLRPGGRLILDTVNPSSLYVFAHSMYSDPTHTQPIHSEYLRFLAQSAGFNDVTITVRTPVPAHDRPTPLSPQSRASLPADVLSHLDKTEQLLFSPQDYMLIATR